MDKFFKYNDGSYRVVTLLIMTNLFIYLLGHIGFISLSSLSLFSYEDTNFHFYQYFTHIFYHKGFLHILFNMLFLYVFGKDVELKLGKQNFLMFYLISGVSASMLWHLLFDKGISSEIGVLGASGAIYGVICLFAMIYPNRELKLFFLLTIKVKYFIGILMVIELFHAVSLGHPSNIVHFLGGLIGVMLYIFYFKDKTNSTPIRNRKVTRKTSVDTFEPSLDDILDKINRSGEKSLSKTELDFLEKMSNK